jgi:hypothetical protein
MPACESVIIADHSNCYIEILRLVANFSNMENLYGLAIIYDDPVKLTFIRQNKIYKSLLILSLIRISSDRC